MGTAPVLPPSQKKHGHRHHSSGRILERGKTVEVHVFSEEESDASFDAFEALCPPAMRPDSPLEVGPHGVHQWAGPISPDVRRGYYLPPSPGIAAVTRCEVHRGGDESEAWAAFMQADVLVLSRSGFSYVPAIYRPRRVPLPAHINRTSSGDDEGSAQNRRTDRHKNTSRWDYHREEKKKLSRGRGAVVYAPFWHPPFADWLDFDSDAAAKSPQVWERAIADLAIEIREALLIEGEFDGY